MGEDRDSGVRVAQRDLGTQLCGGVSFPQIYPSLYLGMKANKNLPKDSSNFDVN